MTIGVRRDCSTSAFSSWQTSKPFFLGMTMSSRTRSGCVPRGTRVNASSPFEAVSDLDVQRIAAFASSA